MIFELFLHGSIFSSTHFLKISIGFPGLLEALSNIGDRAFLQKYDALHDLVTFKLYKCYQIAQRITNS